MAEQDGGQQCLGVDDGVGVRVVRSTFGGHQQFSWELFGGFESCRVLTYSIDLRAVMRLFDPIGIPEVECVVGTQATISGLETVLAAQQAVVEAARDVVVAGLPKSGRDAVAAIAAGDLAFWVLKDGVAHSKIYLLDGGTRPERRVIVGSANLSEQAFSGRQHEELVMYDDDADAWAYYEARYCYVRDRSSQRIDPGLLTRAERPIKIEDAPLLSADDDAVVVLAGADQRLVDSERVSVLRNARAIRNNIGAVLPAQRKGGVTVDVERKKLIHKSLRYSPAPKAEPPSFSISAANRTAEFLGRPFPLEFDQGRAEADARLMIDYFSGFERFSGGKEDILELQEEYFAFWAWLYLSPLMCDLRNRAALENRDVIRYERVAVLYGKSNCGKTSLIKTLLRSMFLDDYQAVCLGKKMFKAADLDNATLTAQRSPLFFDDITSKQMGSTGKDFIKDEAFPGIEEYPAFAISMNRHDDGFADEIVKRAFLINTKTALPVYKHEARQTEDDRIRRVADGLSGHLYKAYLHIVLDKLDHEPLPDDWLDLSSTALSDLIGAATSTAPPPWASPQTSNRHAERRYKSQRSKLGHRLRPGARIDKDSDKPEGWWIEGEAGRLIVRERVNPYGKGAFNWQQVPSTIVDTDASSNGQTSLVMSELHQFLPDSTHLSTESATPLTSPTPPAKTRRRWGLWPR